MKKIKILYISSFPLSGTLSPSINEISFTQTLEDQLGNNVYYFLKESKMPSYLSKSRVSFFDDPPITRPLKFLSNSFKWAVFVNKISQKHGADIIIIRPNRAPLKEILLKLITKKKVVLKSSSKYWMDGISLGFLDNIFRKVDFLLYKFLHKVVDGIECVTQEYKTFHLKNGIKEDKLEVIGNAISSSLFYIQEKSTDYGFYPVLGYCGAKPSERGAKEILFLVEKLISTYPNILGLIVGHDDELQEIIEEAREKNLSKNFKAIGQVAFEEVPNYLKLFDVGYSFTSLSDIVGGDSSMKVRQYLACGVPVITFPLSNQFIEDNDLGCLVNLDDREKLLSCTRELIEKMPYKQKAYKQKLSNYAYQHFSHEEMLCKRMDFWMKILKGK